MKKELLAPAGDIEAGYAALYYGADAVYLGLKQFSARATAQNFGEDELNEFIGFAHHLGRRVFITVNTVLQQGEFRDLLKNLDVCRRTHADAVIIQDLGVARIVKKYYPELEMHASTQMAIHNKAGAQALKELGFSRVVVARELTLAEIKEIATIPDLELEAFVHGALCYSYSGICQFSSMTSGRSANRGKCLYPCRAEFFKEGKPEHCFSMKDLALEEDVLKLPVYSLKIEGRKKNALYVAAVTDYYRNILDGNGAVVEKARNIRQIFSRPWCRFHFNGRHKDVTDTKFVGHRGLFIGRVGEIGNRRIVITPSHKISRHDGIQIDVEGTEKPYGFSLQKFKVRGRPVWQAAAGEETEILLPGDIPGLKKGAAVYLASSSEVKGAYGYQKPRPKEYLQREGIDVEVTLSAGKITAESCGITEEILGKFDKAKDPEMTKDAVKKAFAKTGDTAFELRHLEIKNPEGLFAPMSGLNDLRRRLYTGITPECREVQVENIEPRLLPVQGKWLIKSDRIENLAGQNEETVAEIILLINPDMAVEDILKLPRDRLRIALPAVCRHAEDFEPLIYRLLDAGCRKWEIANYWGLGVLPAGKLDLSFDNLIYMFNVQAIQMAKEVGASRVTLAVEDTMSNLQDLSHSSPLPVTFVVYQDVPLFTSAVCIRENACGCCDRKPLWIGLEREGQKYRALSRDCGLTVFAERPFAAASEARDIRADYYRADFCYKNYTPQQVREIMSRLTAFEDVAGCMKGNLQRRNEMF